METIRQKQVGELIRRNVSIILREEGSYIYGDALVTVTNVMVSPDMSQAKVYVSVYNTEEKQAVVLMIDEQITRIRQALAHRIKKHVRRIPEIFFYLDDTLDEMFRLNSLFDKLEAEDQMGRNRPPEEEEE
ncbi:MAG: 30S ribosome-binding factor RbfA [Saprospiraceae bacterium]|jgi:ribosome-binding factor A|nr:30S ribosome-binding factor RbfA [Saprospiraceae bacterium]